MRRAGRLLGVATALALVTGCAVGAEDRAHVIGADDVPYGLLEEERAGATASVPDGTTVAIYLVRDDELVAVERELRRDAGLEELVGMLAAVPTAAEAAAALTTAVPDPDVYGDVEVVRGTAEVDLAPSFSEIDGATQALAIAQTVFTLTARPGIGRVVFRLDGASVEVPRGDGTLTDEALARDDFPDLLSGARPGPGG
ncbi:GerMN domain-containing protein [Iamia sp. SCSIO 61187]|uniref:GerMN domain-containing protein n=1 Tax=Iamia sp. SCSIO 61187 TaxID=2722752 RepID=UPI001C626602|nr:GerMN domain-containing protein [Iamia sp. SCSIO 61187]QYG94061.1 GerMN domain-containing protein [Iamia sp. SCSIO 61187]